MKLLIYSDLHLEFSLLDVPQTGYDAVVLAGDIHLGSEGIKWAKRVFSHVPVVYICGNHEFYHGDIENVHQSIRREASGSKVYFCENQSVQLGDVRFLCSTLWTDFSLNGDAQSALRRAGSWMNDYRLIQLNRRRLRPDDTFSFHQISRSYLESELNAPTSQKGVTVVVTHHAPSRSSLKYERISPELAPAYASPMDDLIGGGGAALWVHGHTHESSDYWIQSTRVISNPRGYSYRNNGYGNPNFQLNCIIEV